MNKQTLIDDYKQTIERLQKECTEKTDFNIKLMERVKELEENLNAQFAEMEEKLTAEELKNYELKEKLKITEETNEELRAQRDTYTRLMYIYKNISKGRDIMPTEEICPHCDCIVGLPPFLGAYKCPQCGAIILTCSLCQKHDCANCDFSNIIGRGVKILEKKLKIALNSLNDIATFDNYIVAQLDAQQALQKIKEVKNDNDNN